MDIDSIQKYAGKKVFLILANKYRYVGYMPSYIDHTFDFEDKLGHIITISSDTIVLITEAKE